jgi:tetratricopeptide (TPR) repeat protein
MLLIEFYAKQVDRRAATTEFQRQRKRYGDRAVLRAALGLAEVEDDANAAAIATLHGALRRAAADAVGPVLQARMHARLGQALWQAGNFAGARKSADAALALWPSCGRALAVRGIVDYERNRFRTARQHLRQAEKEDPTLALTFHYLGLTEQQLGQRKAAHRAFQRSLQLRPKGPLADEARRALRL